jgi:Fe-S oxidoreductase
MGPNGSGKSTLAAALMGHPAYRVEGEIFLKGQPVHDLEPHERARLGMFLGFQYPVAVPGVSVANFLRAALGWTTTTGQFGRAWSPMVELTAGREFAGDADIMYSVIAPEPKFQAQLIYQTAVIMHVAGVNWTMPSELGWDNSDMAMFTGDNEIMGRIKRAHYDAATRLKVKRIVMGECGHAFRSVYDVGNRWLGWEMPPIPIVHAIEFYYELLKAGKIKITKKYATPITLHDPCNVVRGGGLHEKARFVAHTLCETVVEMEPNREHNYCCAAGGGVINCGPPYKMTRINGNRIKAEQLFAAKTRGAQVLVAPCHNCHSGLHDIVHHYGVGLDIKFFGDIIYEVMEKPA